MRNAFQLFKNYVFICVFEVIITLLFTDYVLFLRI